MRGTILIISALLAVALATGAYVIMSGHGPVPQRVNSGRPGGASPGVNITTQPGFSVAESVYWTRIDKAGHETSRWRFERSDPPMRDGRVKLYNPEIIFYMAKGQMLRARGSTGIITMQEGINRSRSQVANTSTAQQPRSGKCYDVTLEMFSADRNVKPVTVTMNNLAFDNDSMRFVTEAYDDGKGRTVADDEVPVHVRGEDYEFDGYGLTLQYNDVDRRLENLTIARGERLLIKNPRKYLESRSTTRPAVSRSGDPFSEAIYAMRWDMVGQTFLSAAAGHSCPADQALRRGVPGQECPGMTGRNACPTIATSRWRKGEPLAGIELAAADPGAARDAARPAAAKRAPVQRTTTRPVERPGAEDQVYRATFSDVVEVFQAGQKMATADRMELLFVSQEGNSPTTQPADDKPVSVASAGGSDAATVNGGKRAPTTRPSAGDHVSPANPPATQPASAQLANSGRAAPTTNPLDLPVEIHWKGPMKIEPVTGEKPEGLIAGQAIVKLIANPGKVIHVVRDSNNGGKNNLKCATLTYWTLEHRLLLESSRGSVIEMYEERDNKVANRITSDFMDVAQDAGNALLGPGTASIAADMEDRPEGSSKEPMTVAWNDRCNLEFIPGAGDQMIVKQARLAGRVKVNEPNQLTMDADSLDLFFDTSGQENKSTTKPARNSAPPLSQLRANGNVICNVTGPGGPTDVHDIKCDNLDLLTARSADGRLYAHTIVATGNVDIDDAERNVKAGLVSASLGEPTTRPTTKPSKVNAMPGNLERLIANNDVRVLTKKDKNTAECDTLEIHKGGGLTTAILTTLSPDRKSRITWGNDTPGKSQPGTLVGAIIRMVQETEEVTVDGPGQLDANYQPQPDAQPVPVHVRWSQGLYAHGDVIDCVGIPRDANGVEQPMLVSTDTDRAENTASAQTITLTTTRPTTRPSAKDKKDTAGATTKPSGELNVMANRAVRSIELKGTGAPAMVKSVLETPEGARVFVAEATPSKSGAMPALIQFFQPSEAERKLVIPGPGTLKFADTRPPGNNAAAREAADDPMGMRGNMAFAWTRSLVYDRLKKQIEMIGDVQVSRLDNKSDAKPIRLYGNKLLVLVEEPPAPTTRPATTHPATSRPGGLGFMSNRIEIKHIHAEGTDGPTIMPLTIKSGNLHVRAPLLDFDPVKHELTLSGTEDYPVLELDPDGVVQSKCEKFIYNTVTEKVTFRKFIGKMGK